MAHFVTCKYCGIRFDRDLEPAIEVSSRRYAHKTCAEKVEATIPQDEKDLQIEFLQSQIEELKGKIENDANVTNVNAKQNTTNTSTMDSTNGEELESNKPSSVSKISRSKKEQ